MAKKIAILVDLLSPGGVQTTALEEVKNLRKIGFDARLVVLMHTEKNIEAHFSKSAPIEFLSDRFPKLLEKNIRLPYFKFLSTLHLLSPLLAPFYIKKHSWDLIISHGTTTTFTALALFYSKKIPYFTIIYDPMNYILTKVYKHKKSPIGYVSFFLKPLLTVIESKMVKNAASVFVISKIHFDYLVEKYKISPQILHLGINAPKKTAIKKGGKILFLGRWEKEKGIKIVFDLCQKLTTKKFIVAGTWTNKKDLDLFKTQIKKRRLTAKIELITSFKLKDLPKIIKRSAFFAHPNLEAFSLSALEAASYGLSIIIPQGSGATELFEHEKHGLFPKPNDKSAFIDAVLYLAANPQKARQMGQEAARVTKNYTWQRHSKILALEINKLPRALKPSVLSLSLHERRKP